MQKIVKAVQPYIFEGKINFKHKPYDAWVALGGKTAKSHYPPRYLHGLAYRLELPQLRISKREARLRFMQPYSLNFDSFPDTAFYEIIPFFWDVWPENFDRTCAWLKKYNIKTAIFTSSQVVDMIKEKYPKMNVMWCPEGIDTVNYGGGKLLKDRKVDFLEYGRNIDNVVKYSFENLNVIRGQKNGHNLLTHDELNLAMQDSCIVAAYPKSYTNPEFAKDIETLTQRYWECMLSRMVMIGHAPKELIDFIGYNPVVEVELDNPNEQLHEILNHIENYQGLVDKNRETALRLGAWELRMKDVISFLRECGYEC